MSVLRPEVGLEIIDSTVSLVGDGQWREGKTTSSVIEFANGQVVKDCTYSDAIKTYLVDPRARRFLLRKGKIISVMLNDGRIIEPPQKLGAVGYMVAGLFVALLICLIPFGPFVAPFVMAWYLFTARSFTRDYSARIDAFCNGATI